MLPFANTSAPTAQPEHIRALALKDTASTRTAEPAVVRRITITSFLTLDDTFQTSMSASLTAEVAAMNASTRKVLSTVFALPIFSWMKTTERAQVREVTNS